MPTLGVHTSIAVLAKLFAEAIEETMHPGFVAYSCGRMECSSFTDGILDLSQIRFRKRCCLVHNSPVGTNVCRASARQLAKRSGEKFIRMSGSNVRNVKVRGVEICGLVGNGGAVLPSTPFA